MEKEYLISVIIPAFNAEKTIEKSIGSVQMQTYSNWELIIIDDGSTDRTEKICQRYTREDKRIVYQKKDNGGVSTARNVGISVAKGEYIVFCDSDDYLELDALEVLNRRVIYNMADFVIPRNRGIYYSVEGKFDKYVINEDDFELLISDLIDKDDFERLRCSASIYSTCGRMYRREFLLNHHILFDERIKVLEDFCFNLKCLQYAKCIIHINSIVYNYTVYGIEEYRFRRSYENYISSLPFVYDELRCFHANRGIEVDKGPIDLLMGYWVFALENILVSKEKFSCKIQNIKQILKEVQKEKLYEYCTQEYLDTHFKILFEKKRICSFMVVYWSKTIKKFIKRLL